MPTITTKSSNHSRRKAATRRSAPTLRAKLRHREPPILLHTDAQVREYLAAHLTPVRYGPKGQPIYALKDRERLNIIIRPGV
jgi:hypothetical protein